MTRLKQILNLLIAALLCAMLYAAVVYISKAVGGP